MGDRGTRLSLGIALMFMLSSFTSAKYVFVDEPLARTSPALGEEDLFGYATALHRVDNSGADNDFNAAITSARYTHVHVHVAYSLSRLLPSG